MTLAMGRRGDLKAPGVQAYLLLRTGFTVAPILFGLDKFLQLDGRVADIPRALDRSHHARHGAGLHVPGRRGGAHSPPQYYDIALRDFGLMLGALTLNRLVTTHRVEAESSMTFRRAA